MNLFLKLSVIGLLTVCFANLYAKPMNENSPFSGFMIGTGMMHDQTDYTYGGSAYEDAVSKQDSAETALMGKIGYGMVFNHHYYLGVNLDYFSHVNVHRLTYSPSNTYDATFEQRNIMMLVLNPGYIFDNVKLGKFHKSILAYATLGMASAKYNYRLVANIDDPSSYAYDQTKTLTSPVIGLGGEIMLSHKLSVFANYMHILGEKLKYNGLIPDEYKLTPSANLFSVGVSLHY